jgi:hypothetical protein
MMPAIQNLHRGTVASSNPGDQNIVRNGLRGTHWSSRIFGRIDRAEGSTGKGKFFLLAGSPRRICEIAHRSRSIGCGTRPSPTLRGVQSATAASTVRQRSRRNLIKLSPALQNLEAVFVAFVAAVPVQRVEPGRQV